MRPSRSQSIVYQVHDDEAAHSILKQLLDSSNEELNWMINCLELLDSHDAQYQFDSSYVHFEAERDVLAKLTMELTKYLEEDVQLEDQNSELEVQACHTIIFRICCLQLNHCISFLLHLIAAVPEWLRFWDRQQRRWYLLTKLEAGPSEWFVPRSQRIQPQERLRALRETLETHVVRTGNLLW